MKDTTIDFIQASNDQQGYMSSICITIGDKSYSLNGFEQHVRTQTERLIANTPFSNDDLFHHHHWNRFAQGIYDAIKAKGSVNLEHWTQYLGPQETIAGLTFTHAVDEIDRMFKSCQTGGIIPECYTDAKEAELASFLNHSPEYNDITEDQQVWDGFLVYSSDTFKITFTPMGEVRFELL